jgi:acetoacetate decarboxylase
MSYEIQGRTVTPPVEVRRAASWTAQYLVDAADAQRLVPSGLQVATLGSKAMASLSFVRYDDGDLDAYNEVALSIMVRRHDAPDGRMLRRSIEIPTGRIGVYIHRLPVNQSFTLEAGRTIWGYPKFLADISIRSNGPAATCEMRSEGEHILTMTVPTGGLVPLPSRVVPTYTFTDALLRMTDWTVRWTGGRIRRGDAKLELGTHPMSEEIRSLGLPKRPLLTSSVPKMRARFEAPVTVNTAVGAPPRG